MTSRQVTLTVDDAPIELDDFVQSFIEHVVAGMLAALKGTGKIENADILIKGETATVNLNDATVPINSFVSEIICQTIFGMISPLKGVHAPNAVAIRISR